LQDYLVPYFKIKEDLKNNYSKEIMPACTLPNEEHTNFEFNKIRVTKDQHPKDDVGET